MVTKNKLLFIIISTIMISNLNVHQSRAVYKNVVSNYKSSYIRNSKIINTPKPTAVDCSALVSKKQEMLDIFEAETFNTDFTLTYYTDCASENGGYAGITCTGDTLQEGMCASNVYPLGTKIKFEDGSELIVADRGGSNFNNSTRLDVFIPRLNNESDKDYQKRVLNYGINIKKGKIIK